MRQLTVALLLLFVSCPAFAAILNPWLDGTDQVRFAKYVEICRKVEVVVNSMEFKDRVVAMKFTTTKRTGHEVIAFMDVGSETLTPDPNFMWDWGVGFYYKKGTRVIGWTNGKIPTVWINKAKFDYMSDPEIAANIVHEYLHKLGFDHASAKDHKSVPYAVGYLVRELMKSTPAPVPEPVEPNPAPEPTPAPRPVCGWWCRLTSIFR